MAGTFTVNPDFVYEQEKKYNTLITDFESGKEQRRKKWANPKRRFLLRYRNIGQTEYNSIISFFDSQSGAFDTFSWTNPMDSVAYTVRFLEDTLKVEELAYQRYAIEFQF